jgi:hypothetical protein
MESLGLLKTPKKQETKCLEKDLCEEVKMELKSNTDKDFDIQNKKIIKRIEEAKKAKEEREQNQESTQNKTNLAKVVRLPVWPEEVRGVPNVALRSALFSAAGKGPKAFFHKVPLHSQEGVLIRYTGAKLDQCDASVWETVLHMARLSNLGDEFRVSAYQLLKFLGKTDTGKNRTILDKRLSTLNATALEIDIGSRSYEGSLIDEVYRDKKTKEYIIKLNSKLKILFESTQYTLVDWSMRNTLDGKPLAQWLYGYYSSHAEPYPVKIETLHKLCGSETTEIWKFTQNLKKALDELVLLFKNQGQIFNYWLDNDLVFVQKTPSKSQKKHLKKLPKKNNKRPVLKK